MTAENIREEDNLWKQVENGKFNVIYALPEAILGPITYFQKHILNRPKSAFFANLVTIAIDEAHIIRSWGEFRQEYRLLNTLRDHFPNIPFLLASATLTSDMINYVITACKLRNPLIIRQSVRRTNLGLWVIPIEEPDLKELAVLIPKKLEKGEQIPKTLIFLNNIGEVNRIAAFLRQCLPEHLQSHGKDIIGAYHGRLDTPTKVKHFQSLFNGMGRIVVCTDAFGLGVDVRDIQRVVLWDIDSSLYIDTLSQRTGRAGRDQSLKALAVAFASPTNLKDPPATTQPTIPIQDIDPFTVAVTVENKALIQSLKPFMSSMPRIIKGDQRKPTASGLHPSVRWTLKTDGCRQGPSLICFDEEDPYLKVGTLDCDNCYVEYLIRNNRINEPPVIFGIPLRRTIAYRNYLRRNNLPLPETQHKRAAKARNAPSRMGPYVDDERRESLENDLQAWRDITIASKKLATSCIPGRMLLSDAAISKIVQENTVRYMHSEEDIRWQLRTLYKFPGALLEKHLSSLLDCIHVSLEKSLEHQKERQVDKECLLAEEHQRSTEEQPGNLTITSTASESNQPLQSQYPSLLVPRLFIPGYRSQQSTPVLGTHPIRNQLPIPGPRIPLGEIPQVITGMDNGESRPKLTLKIDLRRFREECPAGVAELEQHLKRRRVDHMSEELG
jgi:hypothetical protein